MSTNTAAPLSEVMKRLAQGVEGIKKATLARVKGTHTNPRVPAYAVETVTLLGEIEAAMGDAAGRVAELEGANYFTPIVAARNAPPLLRRPSLSDEPEPEQEEDETAKEGLAEPFEREPDLDTEVDGDLSGDAVTAIVQHVEACAAHEASMEELRAAQHEFASAKPGAKRLASQRLATAQAKIVETWTAKDETYSLQKLLADRARSN
jgi:hypothetical protein